MTLTVSQVLGTKPETLLNAAGDVASVASRLDGQIFDQRTQLTRLAGSWTGLASAAAQRQGADMLVGQEAYRDKLRALQGIMSSGGQQMSTIRMALASMTTGGIAPIWHVADDGSVTPGPLLQKYAGMFPAFGMQVKLKAMEMSAAVKKMLAEFEHADKTTAEELRKFAREDKEDNKNDDGDGKPGDKPATSPGATPTGGNPAAIANQFLDRNASELKGSGELPMDPSIPSDICCANFVSATLQKAGLIDWHSNGVADMSQRLQAQGWHMVPASEARPGDVAIINGSEHTELVYSNNGGQVTLIGSNNKNPDGSQRISYGNPYGQVMYLSPP